MQRLFLAVMSLVLCACGLGANGTGAIGGDDGISEVAEAVICEDPPRTCDVAVPLRNLLSDGELRAMHVAEWFRPPVISGEDKIIGWITVTEDGKKAEKREEYTSDYSLTFAYAGDNSESPTIRNKCGFVDSEEKVRKRNYHMGIDVDIVDKSNLDDPNFPVRAVGDGIVIFAGMVCAGVGRTKCTEMRSSGSWGYMVRILHKRIDPDSGATQYLVSVYAHLAGLGWGMSDSITVSVGDRVVAGQVIASIGNKDTDGGLSWEPHLHFEIRSVDPFSRTSVNLSATDAAGPGYVCSYGELSYNKRLDPVAFFKSYGHKITTTDLVRSHPVGTLVYDVDWSSKDTSVTGKRIYRVESNNTLRHVRDEKAWFANRFWHRISDPWRLPVPMSGLEKMCYEVGEEIVDDVGYELIECSGEPYLKATEPSGSVLRWVPVARNSLEYHSLLRSWGFVPEDERSGGWTECHVTPKGETLHLRGGTVVERASDNDFYVVDDAGKARRLLRDTFKRMGYPFEAVILINDDSLPKLIKEIDFAHKEFSLNDSRICNPGGGEAESDGLGGEESSDHAPDESSGDFACEWQKRRCTTDPARYEKCLRHYEGDAVLGTSWEPFDCPGGQVCGEGGQCVDPPGQTVSVPEQTSDPPHTVRCDESPGGMTVTVSGPLLDGVALMATPAHPNRLTVGSDQCGWPCNGGVDWRGDGEVHSLLLPSAVESFNLKLADSSQDGDYWFRLYEASGSPWSVVGDCRLGEGLILVGAAPAASVPEQEAPAQETPPAETPADPHTIECVASAAGTTVTVTGPLLDGVALMATPANPSSLMLGANGYGWPDAGHSTPWLGDKATHQLVIPAAVSSFNLKLGDATQDGDYWFRLYGSDGSPWKTIGDCRLGSGLIEVIK